MVPPISDPNLNSRFYIRHTQLLCSSFLHWTGRHLIDEEANNPNALIQCLYNAPFVLVSHGTEKDPVFNFGNKAALDLFELDWGKFIQLPSRESVEKISREEREKLMQRVTTKGYIDNYSGVRISSSGKRFLIEDALIWNIVDEHGGHHGQAATFSRWAFQ